MDSGNQSFESRGLEFRRIREFLLNVPAAPSLISNRSISVGEWIEPMLILDIEPPEPIRLVVDERWRKLLVALKFEWLCRFLADVFGVIGWCWCGDAVVMVVWLLRLLPLIMGVADDSSPAAVQVDDENEESLSGGRAVSTMASRQSMNSSTFSGFSRPTIANGCANRHRPPKPHDCRYESCWEFESFWRDSPDEIMFWMIDCTESRIDSSNDNCRMWLIFESSRLWITGKTIFWI